MKKNFILLITCISLFIMSGCVNKLRDYVACEHGLLSLRVKDTFGEGANVKDYFITKDNSIINRGDSSSYLLKILGSPDEIDSSFSGYKIWKYKRNRVMFFVDDGKVKHIYGYNSEAVREK